MVIFKYKKGAHFERELSKELEKVGFKVIRAAGSGSDGTSPDLIALKTTKKFAFECKAHEQSIYLEKQKIAQYVDFENSTGLPVYIAWKVNRQSWKFFPLSFLRETEKSFVISENDMAAGLDFDYLTN